ncbi:ATP-binding protein [Rhizomonospora bruguierae]|uniref:hypothetical protein n=1 Tax=Rhizomonospora bruguierae TaxID=1581705 RepID=UPI0020BF0BCC|nr:hypothetical protein [Micromonospora sp. NBRC 107566]
MQLAELGLQEAPDDVPLLSSAARAAWLAGLVDDALRYGRRWRDDAGTAAGRAEALYLLIRLASEEDELVEMDALTGEVERLIAELSPGEERARAMTAVAHSRALSARTDAALEWADRAIALAEEFGLPRVRLAALVEKGSALTDRTSSHAEGRELLAGLVDEAEKLGEWVLAARALNILVGQPSTESTAEQAELLERMRLDAERAGFEALAVAAYYQGRARLAMRAGDLAAATVALEQGRERERGYQYRGRRQDYHAVFLAGLYLEAEELDKVAAVIAQLSESRASPRRSFRGWRSTWPAGGATGRPPRGSWRSCSPGWPPRAGAAARRRTTWSPPRWPPGCRCPGCCGCARSCSTRTCGSTTAGWWRRSSPRRRATTPPRWWGTAA